ncbi:ABC transporter ATP-binding protein [Portibacter marinus]|uniref:ABC transporter ATP-binding protein n=1 Tax=Portibacter marinus TaxID=2898660 RepID=UPI001F436CFB|nr:ABC transporter ATP-binding protein [Portibacter marinus]
MININNLSFGYSKKKDLFTNLNLEVQSGRICGLLGKNGAGKTSLLRLITGLLFPDEGEVVVLGQTIRERDPDIAKEIFYVQEEYELPSMRISLYKKLYAPFYENFDEVKFYDLLSSFEVDKTAKTNQLSYGQRKKVQIAFALSTGVRLLILDEPTNGLDIPSKAQFRKVLISSIGEDQSVVISSHQVRDLTNLLDQIVIVDEGNVVLNEDIFDISSALSFKQVQGAGIPEQALYHEMVPGGHFVVLPNDTDEQSQIDLEALFNATVTNGRKLKSIFEQHKTKRNAKV